MKTLLIIGVIVVALLVSSSIAGGVYYSTTTGTTETTGTTKATEAAKIEPVTWIPMTGYDYSGNDMQGSPFSGMTQDQCTDKCKNTTGCIAGQYSPGGKLCWLKSAIGASTPNGDRVLMIPSLPTTHAYVKWAIQKDRDHGGDDIACYTDGTSVEKCAALCALHKDCKSYNNVNSSLGGAWEKGGCCIKAVASPVGDIKGVDFYSA